MWRLSHKGRQRSEHSNYCAFRITIDIKWRRMDLRAILPFYHIVFIFIRNCFSIMYDGILLFLLFVPSCFYLVVNVVIAIVASILKTI